MDHFKFVYLLLFREVYVHYLTSSSDVSVSNLRVMNNLFQLLHVRHSVKKETLRRMVFLHLPSS